jgi:hypothetical protein
MASMGLLSTLLTLPFAPVKGVIAIAEIVRDEVDAQLHSPVTIQRELEEVERARAAGEMSEEEVAQAEQQILSRLIEPPAPPEPPG